MGSNFDPILLAPTDWFRELQKSSDRQCDKEGHKDSARLYQSRSYLLPSLRPETDVE